MEAMIAFAALLIATIFAVATAVAVHWLSLRAAFGLMRPATARQPQPVRSELVTGTRQLVRRLATQR